MKTYPFLILVAAMLVVGTASAQIEITQVRKLDLGAGQSWAYPQFSPDGKQIFYSTTGYDGIWRFDVESGAILQITADPKSGYGFAVSPDGKQVAYRRSIPDPQTRRRVQEIVLVMTETLDQSVITSGRSVSLPSFSDERLVYTEGTNTQGLRKGTAQQFSILGIENTKIAVNRNGEKILLDPLGDGSYIWPALSPDGSRIVAQDMSRGTIVFTVDGTVTARIGRRNAAVWTRDGKYLVYMDDVDDGHRILTSDLFSISPDGTNVTQLTRSTDAFEMFPQCSPTEDKIVCNSLQGDIYVLSYREVTP